jgi:hypothetical protein
MKNWTTQAEQRLTEYLEQRAARERFEGEEADELKDDLRRHIHEEAEQSASENVGLMTLEQILGKLEAGYQSPTAPPRKPRFQRGGFWNWTCGVVLPLLVLAFEVTTSFCGSVFFSPVPTGWHTAWLAMVPALNAWLLRSSRGTDRSRGLAAGFAILTAGFYALLFLPVTHWALLGVIFFGIGLLPLTPLLATLGSWFIGRRSKRKATDRNQFRHGWRLGGLAALLVFATLEGPALWTRANLSIALTDAKDTEMAIARLRGFHSERTLLKACYEGNQGIGLGTDISGWIVQLATRLERMVGGNTIVFVDSKATRDIFFRITGKPFNSLKPPGKQGNSWRGRGDPLEDFEFDNHLGGDEVAVRLKNLDLAESRFDGHVDSVSQLGYGEWTLVFKNTSSQVKEARCQMKLPRDGRVSRLTLWVNGEPREAAFSTVAKVKAAYRAIAVVQRRDPVLVNMVGPDTVMVQCFPVPAHGEMKVRLGITAPLAQGRWEMPYIVEQNFGIKSGLEHALWLQGDASFHLTGTGKPLAASADGDGKSLSASLAQGRLMAAGVTLQLTTPPAQPTVVWCEDQLAAPAERILVREPINVTRAAAEQVVVVIDGSASLASAKEWITQSLTTQDLGKFQLILADDRARPVTLAELQSHSFSGGRDNEPALKEAIRLARESAAPVVWIHGPQAVGLSQPEALLQSLERGTIHPVIHDVEAVAGPNRLAEAIYRTGCLHRGPSLQSPEKDLTQFLQDLRTERQEPAWNWKRALTPEGLPQNKVWDQLARTWASQVAENPKSDLTDAARSELAAHYQLVTPFSGAVVLETQRQYEEHGLTPVDPDATPAIPGVPEPSTGVLVILTTAAALLRRRRTP